MMVNNTKPLPVENNGTHKIYKVRLSVAGKVQEIAQFVSALTHSEWIVGLEAFQLRGVQGHNMIECSLSVWMVRLIPVAAVAPAAEGTGTEAM
jgi:Tfp pilus assembly protein PilO